MKESVSVVIPCWSALDKVLKLTQSILRNPQETLLELLLMDDCNTEYNLQELVGSPFKVWRAEKNMGFVRICNMGATLASGQYLLLLNQDTEVFPNWLDPMTNLFQNPKVGIVGSKLLFPKDSQGNYRVQHAGCGFDGGKGPYHHQLGWLASDERTNQTKQVEWVTGASFMVRRDLFLSLGGLDEIYAPRGYFEDADFCMRAKNIGFQTWYCAESVMIHHVGSSMAETSKTPEQIAEASRSFMRNSHTFHKRWDDQIVPDTPVVYVQY